jgi:RHS repeat-associated protein
MRTGESRRQPSLRSRVTLAVAATALAGITGHAPIRAQQSPAPRESVSAGQSATLLPDGSVLLIGGEPTGAVVQIRAVDGRLMTLNASPLTPRAWHTATVLSDGSVLVVGGIDASGRTLAAPERFVPGTRGFEALPGDGFAARARHTATLLTDGRVLIVGGPGPSLRNDAELWDSVVQVARPLESALDVPRAGHTAALQADGRVLITGGDRMGSSAGTGAEIFDPSTGAFQPLTEIPTSATSLYVTGVAPVDGATDVPLDAMIALRFSQVVDVRSVSATTLQLTDPDGRVLTSLVSAEAGRLVFVRPIDPLQPSTSYRIGIAGLITPDQEAIVPATFSFTTKESARTSNVDDEAWQPDAENGWRTGRAPSPWQSLPALAAPPGVTALAGQVLRLNGAPLPGVTLGMDGHAARTDRSGRFLLLIDGLASGEHTLAIDARTASRGARAYGFYEARVTIRAGTTTALPFTIWSPVLDTTRAVTIPSPTTSETVVRTPVIPGLELHLPAGTVIRDEDHEVVRTVTITPIPLDRTPFPLPTDATFTMFFTIQPGGAYIDTPGPIKGAWLVYPNRTTIRSGTKVQFFNYDPDDKGWYVYGLGTVTPTQVIAEPKTRFYAFTGASFNSGPTPPAGGQTPDGPNSGDPVDPSTGAFIMRKTDLYLPDVMPLALTRTYDGLDTQQRAFGTGMTHAYGLFQYTTNAFNDGDLILPDGGRIHYVRTSAAGLPWYQTVFECQAAPTAFYKSRLAFVNNNWEYALKDGTVYVIGHAAALQAIRDRYGNETRLTWSATNTFGAGYGNLLRITSPNGRWIEFTYDAATPVNHITQAKDNIGRTVTYTYTAAGNLATVTDPENNVTTYTWDASNRLVSIKDGRNIVYLTNQYDASNRVTQQTLADPAATYTFAYTTDPNGNITQTDVTDPLAHVERFAFNSDHYVTSRTEAYGTVLARTTTTTRQAASNLVTAAVDGLSRRTEYTYDSSGHVLTETRLAGTVDAVTTTYTYEPVFFQLATITDPLNHQWTVGYDASGRAASVTDPLNNRTAFAMSAAGQVITITDPLQHGWQIGYSNGDLTSLTDPLGHVQSRFFDAAGRPIAITDPAGRTIHRTFNGLDRVTSVTDAMNGRATFTYDNNGNLLSLSDASGHTNAWAYNALDRVASRTDPLTRVESYAYNKNGDFVQFTDRKGQVTTYTYDALGRRTQTTYHDASTTQYTYDAGDRIVRITDSVAGTITRTYDGLDALTSETTPEGSISYTYDLAGRRVSTTVSGQTQIAYGYDVANQLTSITQGASVVSFAYDAANRRTSVTLPNGMVTEYGYNSISQITSLTYKLAGVTIGDLTYSYGAAGEQTTLGGSWARTNLPAALTSATYDAANEIARWGGVSFTYDANGSLTNDGTNTYTWNARNQLGAISGGTSASFGYDAVARRRSKTGASTTTFLYDGVNAVQELAGGTPTANLLTGPGIDEYFKRTDTQATHLATDVLGSTVALSDGSGVVQTSYSYDPFGTTTSSGATSANRAGFTGREIDVAGLYYLRSRYYSPVLGAFLSEDPIQFASQTVNLYEYAYKNPTRFRDPMGTQAVPIPAPGTLPIPIPWLPWLTPNDVIPADDTAASRGLPDPESGNPRGGRDTKKCNPCKPPVGTYSYRYDQVPPAKGHFPYIVSHYHIFQMHQSPPSKGCKCFWKPLGVQLFPPFGSVPITDACGGGVQ